MSGRLNVCRWGGWWLVEWEQRSLLSGHRGTLSAPEQYLSGVILKYFLSIILYWKYLSNDCANIGVITVWLFLAPTSPVCAGDLGPESAVFHLESSASPSLTSSCRKYSQELLSLVQLLHYCAVIGQLFYVMKTSSRHPKPPARGISCLSLVLYGIKIAGFYAQKESIIESKAWISLSYRPSSWWGSCLPTWWWWWWRPWTRSSRPPPTSGSPAWRWPTSCWG